MAKRKSGDEAQTRALVRIGAVLGGVALIAVVAWLVFGGDDESTESGAGEAEIVTIDSLHETADSSATPIYWAGAQEGSELELSEPEEGRVYVRYLTDGTEAGESRSDLLTVGTYSFPDADQALKDLGGKGDGVLAAAPGGGVVYFDRTKPQNIYLAYPGDDVQIEVYDPDPKRALELVTSGQVVPAG